MPTQEDIDQHVRACIDCREGVPCKIYGRMVKEKNGGTSRMECMFCRKGPADGVDVFRVNAKGEPGKWACKEHIQRTDAEIPREVREVVSAIKGN